jgi:hypothetical protein
MDGLIKTEGNGGGARNEEKMDGFIWGEAMGKDEKDSRSGLRVFDQGCRTENVPVALHNTNKQRGKWNSKMQTDFSHRQQNK